mmetsp:Transcript_2258/g.6577  ORF Transcript_2258/g.6577 Transcript_2258/m.6577 type:complete len:332 (+) Transcript_2258:43-1038(+)
MQSDGDDGLSRQQLRMQKNRVIKYVEQLVPPSVLAAGVLIMVMQVDSPVNGSMYHTVISIVFPLPEYDGFQFIEGIKESGEGGTYRTTIYRPIIDVTRDDVLDAFPEQFPGGRRTMERLAYRARDVAISHIQQDFGEGNAEAKREVSQFVIDSVQKYLERDCVPPPLGQAFPISPEERVIAAVAKTNIQRKEYSKTRKKVEKIVKARDQRDQEYQQALHAQQQQEQKEIAASPPPTPTKKNYSDDDSDPFENVHNPLRYRDPPGDRASVMGVPLVVDVPSVVERSERTGTAEVSSLPRRSGGAMQGAEEPPGSFSKRKVSLKKMLKKKLQT